jgi:predicted aldo/keto reductase-like oxidoreductase
MSIGSAWSSFMGECSKETAFEVLDYFYSQGGNFIDTANGYQNGESEQWIGEWMELRGRRAEMVVATKYTSAFMTYRGEEVQQSNFGGNSKKSLRVSVDLSLKQLRTEYIDLVGWFSLRLVVHDWHIVAQMVFGDALTGGLSCTSITLTGRRVSRKSCSRFIIWSSKERCSISASVTLQRRSHRL